MSWPRATRSDHDQFCRMERWHSVRDARGRSGTHHITYELALPNGRVLRTRISRPADRSDYGRRLWSHILRDQLEVSEEQFWACVRDGQPPVRGGARPPTQGLPAEVAHLLLNRVGLSEAELGALSKDEALARLHRYWTEGS